MKALARWSRPVGCHTGTSVTVDWRKKGIGKIKNKWGSGKCHTRSYVRENRKWTGYNSLFSVYSLCSECFIQSNWSMLCFDSGKPWLFQNDLTEYSGYMLLHFFIEQKRKIERWFLVVFFVFQERLVSNWGTEGYTRGVILAAHRPMGHTQAMLTPAPRIGKNIMKHHITAMWCCEFDTSALHL